jgi:hypothetical protein
VTRAPTACWLIQGSVDIIAGSHGLDLRIGRCEHEGGEAPDPLLREHLHAAEPPAPGAEALPAAERAEAAEIRVRERALEA